MPFPAFFLLAAALGGREVVNNRREKGRLIDLEAERQDTINNIDIGLNAQTISNEFDAQQVEAMARQEQTALTMLSSKNPALQAAGSRMLQSLQTGILANIQQNETEARADRQRLRDQEVLQAGALLAENEGRLARGITLNEQLREDIAPVLDAQVKYDKINNLLDNNNFLASVSGLTAFVQSIDDSVVREGELLKYQGANGLIIQLVNLVNKAEGKDFDKTTKQSIRNAAAALVNAERARGLALTTAYQARAISFNADPKVALSGIEPTLFNEIPFIGEAQELTQEFDAGDFEVVEPRFPATFITATITGAQDILSEIRQGLTGAKLLSNDQGELFEQATDGTITQVGQNNIFTTADGRTLELVDNGNGNFSWNEVDRSRRRPPGFIGSFLTPEASESRRARRAQRGAE